MRNPSGRFRRLVARLLVVALVVALLVPGLSARPAAAAGYPALPVGFDSSFLSDLSVPSVVPGGSSSIAFNVTDPTAIGAALSDVVVSFEVYAFNGFPGNATAYLSVADAPVLVNATASGAFVTVGIGSLPSGHSRTGSVGVVTSAASPAGTFAIRTAVNFTLNSTAYRLESRGWFTASQWAKGTEAPNGNAVLNLSALGNISGIVPETAILVAPAGWDVALAALLVGGFVLVGIGAYVYFRRKPGSSSGAG